MSRIDGIYLSTSTVDTIFGTIIHNCVQKQLQTKQEQINRFERTWKKFSGLYQKYLDTEQTKQYFEAGVNILQNINLFVENEFGKDFEVLSVEEELLNSIDNTDIKFKAFVDLVILDRKNERLVILDLKSCSNAFMWKKYAGKEKERQLVFYKYFYSLKHELDPKDIQTIFLLLIPIFKKPLIQ